jgi:hypothetical protein
MGMTDTRKDAATTNSTRTRAPQRLAPRLAPFVLLCVLALCPVASAQTFASTAARDAFFARLVPGSTERAEPGHAWQHRDGRWTQEPTSQPVSQVLTSAPEPSCDPFPNPYTDGDAALACALLGLARQETLSLPTFTVGQRYTHAYPGTEMVVLSVTRTLEGRTAVTAQYVTGADSGQVFAFVVSAESGVWTAVTR